MIQEAEEDGKSSARSRFEKKCYRDVAKMKRTHSLNNSSYKFKFTILVPP